MFNTIEVTEDNFESIMKRLQKICNKHKMIKFYKVFKENNKEQKEYRNSGIRIDKHYVGGIDNLKRKYKLVIEASFIKVTKHHFREAYESEEKSYESDLYNKMHSLIHMDTNCASVVVLSVGDKIRFLPFGIFNTWTDDDYTRFENPLTIYKETFVPYYFKGKIDNLDNEIKKREEQWEKENEWWMEQDRKEMEQDYLYESDSLDNLGILDSLDDLCGLDD